eukprot:4075869-Lingulodinium_polyedra.AAC.1
MRGSLRVLGTSYAQSCTSMNTKGLRRPCTAAKAAASQPAVAAWSAARLKRRRTAIHSSRVAPQAARQ